MVMELACFAINNEPHTWALNVYKILHWFHLKWRSLRDKIEFFYSKTFLWCTKNWKNILHIHKEIQKHIISIGVKHDFEWQVKTLRYHENLRINDSFNTAKAFTDYMSMHMVALFKINFGIYSVFYKFCFHFIRFSW